MGTKAVQRFLIALTAALDETPEYEPDWRDLEPYWSDSLTEIERQNSIKGR